NFLTARDLRDQGVDAAAVRLLFWQTHYRKPLDFSDEALAAAAAGVKRLGEFRARLVVDQGSGKGEGELAGLAATFEAELRAALDDDLNAPQACAGLFDFVHSGHAALDARASGAASALAALDRAMGVLDILPTAKLLDPTFLRWEEDRTDFPVRRDQHTPRLWERGVRCQWDREARGGGRRTRRVATGVVGCPSGQREQTVNLPATAYEGSNPSPTTPSSARA